MSSSKKSKITNDVVQTFQLEETGLRGRIVKLGPVLDDILSRHKYPDLAAQLTGETLILSLLLSSLMKYDGIFTLQAQGDGAMKMLVADCTSDMAVRSCAGFDEDSLAEFSKTFLKSQEKALSKDTASKQAARMDLRAAPEQDLSPASADNAADTVSILDVLGKGHMAFTVDQGKHTDRYQGIVALEGETLADCVRHYFNQSEQLNTGIRLAVGQRDGKWYGGAIIVQMMPEDGGTPIERGVKQDYSEDEEDGWRRTMILLDSCRDDELLDPELHHNDLLIRLFHEEGVRVYEEKSITRDCRCETDRIRAVLKTMPREDIEFMTKDGEIEVKCEFCSKEYRFDPKEI